MSASGTSYNGTITTGNNTLVGGSGVDVISSGSGNDYINAGSGNDIVDGGSGFDTILAGSGSDTLIYKAYENQWILNGNGTFNSTTQTLTGGQVYTGTDTFLGAAPTATVLVGATSFQGYDSYDGGNGTASDKDVLQIWLSADQLADPAIRAEINYFRDI